MFKRILLALAGLAGFICAIVYGLKQLFGK